MSPMRNALPLAAVVVLGVAAQVLAQLPTIPGGMCRDGADAPVKCLPFPANVIQEILPPASLVTTSTCNGDVFCGRSDPVGAPLTSDIVCSTCAPNEFNDDNLHDVEVGPDVDRSRWLSATFSDPATTVSLTGTFLRPFVLSSFRFSFYYTIPQAIIVEKSVNFGSTFTPYIYFAVDCFATFQLLPTENPASLRPSVDSPNVTVCITITNPGQSGEVFYNLRDRRIPSSANSLIQTEISIETDPELAAWLNATDIRISLLETTQPTGVVGNSSFNFYSAFDLSVVGTCQCFGHATGTCEAGNVSNVDFGCNCRHFTTGLDCSVCLPGYVDVPWRPSLLLDPFECQICDCNNHAVVANCLFNATRYAATGSTTGGVCQGCQDNTAGPQCETCARLFYPQTGVPQTSASVCTPCACLPGGVTDDGDCAKMAAGGFPNGQCNCKANTMGRDCSVCTSTSYDLQATNALGCTDCECIAAGTVGGSLECDATLGQCSCKDNVQGRQCGTCRPGFFGLDAGSVVGCQPCDCQFGSSVGRDVCDGVTGQCTCRPGFTGRRCDTLLPNYYVPDYESIRVEAEDQADATNVQLPVPPGSSQFQSTGRGFALVPIPNSNQADFRLVLPGSLLPNRGHTFCVFLRYVLMGVPTGATATILDVSPAPSGSNILTPTLIAGSDCSSASLGQVTFASCGGQPCPTYTITIRFMINPAPTTIYVDSLVLRPDITLLAPANDPLRVAYDANACRASCVAPAACSLLTPSLACKPLEVMANAELYEGARMCACSVYSTVSACEECGGQCSCVSNVVGRTCTQCQAGTYDLTLTGCTDCDCFALGSTSQVCDFTNGQCVCQSGRTGRRCDECLPNHYPNPTGDGTCLPCNCHPVGAVNMQCNMTGFCECNPAMTGITGMTCDMCNCELLNTVAANPECTADGQCTCGPGSSGQKCENCLENFFFATGVGCQACMCNNHASVCTMAGCMDCADNTAGQMCQLCLPGFYGDATGGTTTDCQQCQCNNWATTCQAMPAANLGFRCDNCMGNTMGDQCQDCFINHFGTPLNGVAACQPCLPRCNNNINVNVPNSCDAATGECLICTGNTEGSRCERCAAGFFGDATVANGCQPCACDVTGSSNLTCNAVDGTCVCHPGVVGPQCTACEPRFFGFGVGAPGCDPCNCNTVGSTSLECDDTTGQCTCQPNIIGVQCDACAPNTFGFSATGCTPCNCNTDGTINQATTCDNLGQCPCEPNTLGLMCNQCDPGFFFVIGFGCSQCPCNGRSNDCTIGGTCLNCMGNSFGANCESCLPEFYNDTSSVASGVCTPCACGLGSINNNCNPSSGQCDCQPGVDLNSRTCAVCADGSYDLTTAGCTACDCQLQAPVGSRTNVCNKVGGQCDCFAQFTQRQCDACTPGFYDFPSGCPACDCSPVGSQSTVCDATSGQCVCRPNIVDRQCDACAPDTFGFSASGCTPCNCNATGQARSQCDLTSGECTCQFGVGNNGRGGRQVCEQCQDGFFGFSSIGCTACDCNMTTSRSTVCDKTGGQCDCHVNIEGRTCNRCVDSHVVFTNGSGCTPCPCNMVGSAQTQCNRTNGDCPVMCFCNPNVVGCFCDRCDPRFNIGGFPTCQDCNCSQFGSVNGSCDTAGQCLCRTGSLGLKCEECEENFFLTAMGCVECPECYREVRDKVLSVRMRLEVLRILIDRLLNSTLLTSDPPVVDRISTLLQQACDLLDDTALAVVADPRIRREINELQFNVTSLEVSVTNLVRRVRRTRLATGVSSALVEGAETQINRTILEVNTAYNNTVFVNGPRLGEAIGLLAEIISLRSTLTDILITIATTAAELRATAQLLQGNAAAAVQMSTTALDEANSAVTTAMNTADVLRQLGNLTADAPDVLAIAGQAQAAAYSASATAMDQLTRAQQMLPGLDLVGDGATIAAAAQYAVDLLNRSQTLDSLVQENCARAEAYYRQLANLTARAGVYEPEALSLYMRAAQANAAAQGFATRVTYIIERATLARDTLADFNAATSAARQGVDSSLSRIDGLRANATRLRGLAQSLLDNHTAVLATAQAALSYVQIGLNASQSAANLAMTAVTATNSTLIAFQMAYRDISTAGRAGVEQKLAGANASLTACEGQRAVAAEFATQVELSDALLQNITVRATTVSTRAQAVAADLATIGSLPTTRLSELATELESLREELSAAQLSQAVTTLRALIITQRGRLTTYRATMTTLAADIVTAGQMRDNLRSTCPVV